MHWKRTFKHLLNPPWSVRKAFPPEALKRIESAIANSENEHSGEIRFAVESSLDIGSLLGKVSCRERAIQVFSELRIWDTEQNNGVLIYLLLADHAVEIVADRGINQVTTSIQWQEICLAMENLFRQGQFEQAVLVGIQETENLLTDTFPSLSNDQNELPNKPMIL